MMSDKPLIYLDHSATTPVDPQVVEVVSRTMLHTWGNPSSRYGKGNEAQLALQTAREEVASLLHADPNRLYFTSGGTEADNLALFGVMEAARKAGKGDHLIVSAIEHSAVLKAAETLSAEGFNVSYLPVDSDGIVDPDKLRAEITSSTRLVSVMAVNNEVGTIQPVAELAAICHEHGALFHTDAVQAYGKIPLDIQSMNLDLVSISSHKIYGPKGVGALYVGTDVQLEPRARGGGQEKGMRTGTENMPGIAGFGKAAVLCTEHFEEDRTKIGALRDDLLRMIQQQVEGEVRVNGSTELRFYGNLNLCFPGIEAESLLQALDLDGIAVSTGSACSSGSTKPSHVLLALGMEPLDAQASLRLTLGRTNTEEQITLAAQRIAYHVNRLRAMAF